MQRVFLIHGWGGSPDNDWFPWVKNELEKKGYKVYIPKMPETEHPKIIPWMNSLMEIVGIPRLNDIFIGHSIGCQTILRYLETLSENQKVGKVILIAPWWFLTLDEGEEQADADPWLEVNVDLQKIKEKANKFITVFSDNDPFVALKENAKFFRRNLDPEVVIKEKMGHFTENDNIKELPLLLEFL